MHAILMTTQPRFLLEHENSSHVSEIIYYLKIDETDCSGKSLRHFMTIESL